jgi:hypothetical protein
LQAGESFNSSDLTLRTFNFGNIVLDSPSGVTLAQAQNWTLASSSAALNIGSGLLDLDTNNARVGIGVTAPTGKFEVAGANIGKALAIFNETGDQPLFTASVSGVTKIVFDHNGYIGIGTTNPAATLDVRALNGLIPTASISGATGKAALMVDNNGTGDLFTASSSGAPRFTITQNGLVGIGTTIPTQLLNVVKTAQTSTGEVISEFGISDDTTAKLRIYNSTSTDGIFQPSINGIGSGTSTALVFTGTANTDTGSSPAIILQSGNSLTNRPVLDIRNSATSKLIVTANGNVGLSTNTPQAQFHVQGAYADNAAAIINQTFSGDIFAASTSGTTKFRIANSGNIIGSGTLTGLTGLTSSGTITFSGFSTNGGLLYTNGSGALAQTTAGASGECLISNGGGAPTWGSCAGAASTSGFNAASGALSPSNSTLDLLIGGTASTSAKFAFLNVSGGTPTASIAGTTANNALFLTGEGNIQTTNANALTLGGTSTGFVNIANNAGTNFTTFDTINSRVGINNTQPVTGFQVSGSQFAQFDGGVVSPFFSVGEYSNALLQSEAFGTSWVATTNTVGTNLATDPMGTVTAENITSTGGSAEMTQTVTDATTGAWTFSVWAKMQSGTGTVQLRVDSSAETGTPKTFNLTTNWQRIAVTQNFVSVNTTKTVRIMNGTNNIAVWGGMAENNANVRGYVVTTTVAATLARTAQFRQAINSAGAITSAGGISGTTGSFTSTATFTNNALTNTQTDRIVGTNNTAALVGAQTQNSPAFRFTGQAWDTTRTVSNTINFRQLLQVNPGASTSGTLVWAGDFANGGYNNIMGLTSGGTLGIGTISPLASLDVRNSRLGTAIGTTPTASFSGSTAMAALLVDNSGSGDLFTASSSGLSRFTITQNGNVGVGTTLPNFRLDLTDAQASTVAAMITNSNTGTNADGLAIKLGYASGAGNANNYFETYLNGSGEIVGKVQASATGVSYASNGIDLAEYMVKDDPNAVIPVGTMVCQGTNGVKACTADDNVNIVGIISDRPAFLGGVAGPDKVIVAMTGQVPLRVTTEHGKIFSGDALSVSSKNGVSSKLSRAGGIVGTALANYTNADPSQEGTIMVYISRSYADVDNFIKETDVAGYTFQDITTGNSPITEFALKTPAGQVVDRIITASHIVAANITAGTINAKVINTDELNIQNMSLSDYISQVVKDMQVQSASASAAATSSAALATSQPASGSGSLAYTQISTSSGTVAIQPLTATESAQLIHGAFSDITLSSSDIKIDLSAASVTQYLDVSGSAYVGNYLGVNNAVVVGNGLSLTDTGLDFTKNVAAQNRNLNLLASGKGSLNILNGQMKITEKGQVTIAGDLNIAGRVTYEDKDAGGFAIIKKGDTQVTVNFVKPFIQKPVVTATADNPDLLIGLKNKTATSFTIYLKQPALQDETISWTALMVKDARTYDSNGGITTASGSAVVTSPASTVSGQVSGVSTQSAVVGP